MRLGILLAALLPAAALADSEAIQVELITKALQGAGQPALVVHAQAALKSVTLEVVRSTDHKKLVLSSKSLAAGAKHRFPLELAAPGKARFEGKLAVVTASGESAEMPIAVDAELIGSLSLQVAAEDLDLAKRTLAVTANRAVTRVEVELTSDQGTPMGVFDGLADGARATISWPEVKGTVLRMNVKAYDADGFFGAIDLFPWRVDIPHEEVNFASGSDEIAKTEAPKLESSFGEIQAAVKKFGKLATIRLFIAGHTDTVGDPASNRGLSERRAVAIGRWFKKRGVSIAILSAGFGEDVPLVKTADEVDEAKNRRAEYIVAVEAPTMRGRSPWAPLR